MIEKWDLSRSAFSILCHRSGGHSRTRTLTYPRVSVSSYLSQGLGKLTYSEKFRAPEDGSYPVVPCGSVLMNGLGSDKTDAEGGKCD